MKALRLPLAALALQASLALAQTPLVTGIDRSGFDAGVRPQDDLFKAVNGQWVKDTPIPADKGDYGLTIQLRDQSDARVRAIVEALAQQMHPTGSVEQKIGDYYRSYMDEAAIDRAGVRPLAPWLAQIDGVRSKSALAALFGRWQGVAATPIQAWVQSDFKQPGINRALTWQGDLGLPDRDYYLLDDARFGEAREAYRSYLQTLFQLSGDANAAASTAAVFALEKRLAQTQWTRVDNRDAQKIYNPMTLAALTQAAPGFDWPAFFRAAALPAIDRLSVSQPSYAAALAKTVADTPLASWKLYLRARLLDAAAPMLPQAFRDAHFAFHGRALLGLQAPKPRWQDAIHELNGALGEAVGQVYVARHFPAAHKARMQQLVNELLAAYAQSIGELSWMGPATKRQAQHKLAKIVTKIGYPERWRDYARLQVRPGDALGNAARAGRFDYERVARREGRPVDRGEW
ncbi:MAG TPA: M13 family metallopeptidase, partial [Albitalea sp.]|nr:M13 family metallopeptidase [Albitalea sp.]